MMRRTFPLAVLALAAACSEPDTATNGSESDFASRVGTAQGAAATTPATPGAVTAVRAAPAPGADVFAPEQLGDISGVDLGPRAGGCTFSEKGKEMLVAAGPADRALPGRAAIRVGGQLLQLDAAPGGVQAIKAGTTFTGEGFSVQVQPTGGGRAMMTITQGADRKQIAGDYVCA